MYSRTVTLGAVVMALGFTTSAFAQAPPPALPAPLAPPAYCNSAAPVVSGRVKQFLPNPNGEIDGLLLADGTQVNFPPHLTAALLQVVRIGDLVSVQGVRGPAGAVHARLITNGTTKRSMVDQPSMADRPPPAPPALMAINAEGRVIQLLHADMGELSGAILEDGTVVRWPPPFGAELQTVLQTDSSLKASGYGSQSAYGKAMEATTVTVNGQAPVSVYGPRPPAPPAPGPSGAPPVPKLSGVP